jgi:hypothetical protein
MAPPQHILPGDLLQTLLSRLTSVSGVVEIIKFPVILFVLRLIVKITTNVPRLRDGRQRAKAMFDVFTVGPDLWFAGFTAFVSIAATYSVVVPGAFPIMDVIMMVTVFFGLLGVLIAYMLLTKDSIKRVLITLLLGSTAPALDVVLLIHIGAL